MHADAEGALSIVAPVAGVEVLGGVGELGNAVDEPEAALRVEQQSASTMMVGMRRRSRDGTFGVSSLLFPLLSFQSREEVYPRCSRPNTDHRYTCLLQ